MLTWEDDNRFVLGETTFHTLAPDAFFPERAPSEIGEEEFLLFKPRSLVERYAALIDELQPQHIFELGILQGGSTVFFAELARPLRVVAIDLQPRRSIGDRIESHAASRGLPGVVRTFDEVDQADRHRLAQIVGDVFDGAALDLVVDDCSHRYEETRASFNELFPRLRPSGVYVIEDWPWAHTPLGVKPLAGLFPDQVPLTRLLFEILLVIPAMPGLITEITIDHGNAFIRRGETRVDPATFEVSACSNPRGRALLAPI